MELDGGQQYYLKPMNCPFHILIYKSRQRSYRELPLRLFEFGTVYRYEKSGVVHGLTRVRGMTQDDAHIFCTREQMDGELRLALCASCSTCCATSGSTTSTSSSRPSPRARPSAPTRSGRRPPRRCAQAASAMGLELVMDEGGGAFYGPKISVQARDAIGRTWQMSTIQLDFQMPQRFGMEYVGADNARHRPIMIHRALFGSVERFFAVLIEHYAGALPTWLCPEQVRVLPVRDDHAAYARGGGRRVRGAGAAGRRRRRRRAARARIRRAKLEQDALRPRRGRHGHRRRTVGVNARGSARARAGSEHRLVRFVERPEIEGGPAACGRRRGAVSLDHLWAGWRSST